MSITYLKSWLIMEILLRLFVLTTHDPDTKNIHTIAIKD